MGLISSRILEDYIDSFNAEDHELYRQHIPNEDALQWMSQNIPLFECPDDDIQKTYYFRWWTYRKHIKETCNGFIITEFLPTVHWAGPHNGISCPAAHHFREGRWLKDKTILRDYALYWLRGEGKLRSYSFWVADAVLAYSLVTGDKDFAVDLLPDLIENFEAWNDHKGENGLYWQQDDRDGMECSISGMLAKDYTGYRATINSYMYGDAMAISKISEWAEIDEQVKEYRDIASQIKKLTEETLWDSEASFFKVLPRADNPTLAEVKELHGYTPWYFNLPDQDKSEAWSQLMDPEGFSAPYGLTTAERRHPEFIISYEGHGCQWNGPSWPFSTSVTLTGMANLLNDYEQDVVSKEDYLQTLKVYAASHQIKLDDGRVVPWIDENLNPFTGEWIARAFVKTWEDGKANPEKTEERGKDYNHSTYCDLIINGLVGLRPQPDGTLMINPLIPDNWDYFCLEGVEVQDKLISIVFDRTGERYGLGKGLHLLSGKEILASSWISKALRVNLNSTQLEPQTV